MNSRLGLYSGLFLLVVVGSGVTHGLATGRWVPLAPIDGYVARLNQIPLNHGTWVGTEQTLEDDLQTSGVSGYKLREYRDVRTGDTITLFAVCGRPGPISVHTPDVCYRGAGFEPYADPAKETIDKHTTWRQRYRPPGPSSAKVLSVAWGWLADDHIVASDSPRLDFAAEPALFKVYVIRQEAVLPDDIPKSDQTDPTTNFIRDFFPVMEDALQGTTRPGA